MGHLDISAPMALSPFGTTLRGVATNCVTDGSTVDGPACDIATMVSVVQCGVVAAIGAEPTVRSCRISQTPTAATASPRGTPQEGIAAMNPIKPATPRAIDNATGKARARHDAMPNRAHPSANSTTVTSHALTRELPVRSAVNVSGVTPVIHGMAKPSNHMSPAKATVPVTVIQKATAPNTPASGPPASTTPPKQSTAAGR